MVYLPRAFQIIEIIRLEVFFIFFCKKKNARWTNILSISLSVKKSKWAVVCSKIFCKGFEVRVAAAVIKFWMRLHQPKFGSCCKRNNLNYRTGWSPSHSIFFVFIIPLPWNKHHVLWGILPHENILIKSKLTVSYLPFKYCTTP